MRITYLDHLRAICMVFVVALHAYYLIDYAPAAPFAVLIYNFGMGTFFIISGYVLAATLPDGPNWPHLKDRLRSLAWPLATGLLLVNPLTLALIHDGFNAAWAQDVLSRAVSGRLFVHLWFLFSLMGFVCAVPLILRALRSAVWAKATSINIPAAYIATAITLVAAAVQMLVAGTIGLELPVPFDGFTSYAWAYVVGLALYYHPKAWEAVHKPGPLPFVIAGLFWLAMIDGWATPGTTLSHMLHAARIASSTAAISFGLLWTFRRFFNRTTAVWSFISAGALTTYILQWLVLHALLTPLTALGLEGGMLFTALIICTLAIKLPTHHFIVSRVPLLALMLNGTPLSQRPAQSDKPAQLRPDAQPSSS